MFCKKCGTEIYDVDSWDMGICRMDFNRMW